jgi:hypothetical protein
MRRVSGGFRVLDRSHLLPPGTIESVMKGMHDANAP